MGPLRIRHLARTNRNALGGKGFGGNIFVAHGGKIFAISVFSLTSSFPVSFFSEPWKTRRPLQLRLTPTLTLHTWISFHFFGGRQRSPLGLYHSLSLMQGRFPYFIHEFEPCRTIRTASCCHGVFSYCPPNEPWHPSSFLKSQS